MSIYKSGIGDELINPQNYNDEILLYLEEELKLVRSITTNFETIIEAGCMNGRYLTTIHSLNKKYIGIDIEKRYIDEAINKYSDFNEAIFICNDIINMEYILNVTNFSKKNAIILFPFNSFGNILDNFQTLITLLSENYNIVIFTYKNDIFTNRVREEYYIKSGFKDILVEKSIDVVRFYTANGLNSKAFSSLWFDNAFNSESQPLFKHEFSRIGIAYSNIKEIHHK